VKQKGFTLIELMAVIAVVAILTGMTIGTLRYVQEKADRSRAEADLELVRNALEEYRSQYGDYPTNRVRDDIVRMFDEYKPLHKGNKVYLPREYLGYIAGARLVHQLRYATDIDESELSLLDYEKAGIRDEVGQVERIGGQTFATNAASRIDIHLRAFVDPWDLPYMYQYEGPGRYQIWSYGWQKTGTYFQAYGEVNDGEVNDGEALFENYDPRKRIGDGAQ
jgi:prepilin-type N-terminal cleavage/methylation domain-containing protein